MVTQDNLTTGEESSFEILDLITISSLILQIIDHNKTAKQLDNDVILRELQRQDKVYLDKIIENQNKILSILSEIQKDMSVR